MTYGARLAAYYDSLQPPDSLEPHLAMLGLIALCALGYWLSERIL